MTFDEMSSLLATLVSREDPAFDPPSDEDWEVLETKFRCKFGDDFRTFIRLMATYSFPGDIFNVSRGRTNGNDPIQLVYDLEVADNPRWDVDLIPFYGVGNGDYFCLNKAQCPQSPVYYYYADRGYADVYAVSFEKWVNGLQQFLA